MPRASCPRASASRCSSAASRRASTGSTSLGVSPRWRLAGRSPRPRSASPRAQLGWQVLQAHGDVQPDPEHGPVFLRPCLDQDARELRQRAPLPRPRRRDGQDDVVGPLDARLLARRASHTATAAISGSSSGGSRSSSDISSGAAGGSRPAPSLPAAPGGLLVGGDERPVGRAGDRELARALVGGPGPPQVQARMAEAREVGGVGRLRAGAHAGRTVSSSSAPAPNSAAAEPRFTASATMRVASS